MNDARILVPILYALSCSSPFLEGRRTGLKSSRVLRAFGFPRTGIPDPVENVAELDSRITSMRNAGVITDAGQLWWDIRLHHVYPTIEFRVADAVPRVQDVTALAALAQAFVAYLLDAYRRGIAFGPLEQWILCENRWRAARFGTEADLIAAPHWLQAPPGDQLEIPPVGDDPRPFRAGTLQLQSVQSIVAEICDCLMPMAAQLGTTEYLEQCQRIAQTGSAADRQLGVAGASNSELCRVVRQYCQETLAI
jgi:carboxylate-amine ligase